MGSVGKSSSFFHDKSYAETRDWFNEHSNYSEWVDAMEDAEDPVDSIYNYTGEHYSSINHYLRTGDFVKPDKYFEQSKADREISELDYAISSFTLSSPIQVYRASDTSIFGEKNLSYEQLRSFIGRKVTDKGYMSTSLLKSLPGEQTVGGNVTYVVDVPSGKGVGAYISKFSENSQEREFLIKRNGGYAVRDIQRDKDGHITVYMKLLK